MNRSFPKMAIIVVAMALVGCDRNEVSEPTNPEEVHNEDFVSRLLIIHHSKILASSRQASGSSFELSRRELTTPEIDWGWRPLRLLAWSERALIHFATRPRVAREATSRNRALRAGSSNASVTSRSSASGLGKVP